MLFTNGLRSNTCFANALIFYFGCTHRIFFFFLALFLLLQSIKRINNSSMMAPITAILEGLKKASFSDVTQWKDAKVSAVFLSLALVMWYFLFSSSANAVTTVSRLVDVGLLLGAINRFGYLPAFSEENLLRLQSGCAAATRGFLHKIYPVLVWEEPGTSAVLLITSFLVSIIAPFISYSTGFLLIIIAVFAVPVTYKKNQKLIDEQLKNLNALVGAKLKNKSAQHHVDPLVKGAKEKLKEVREAASPPESDNFNPYSDYRPRNGDDGDIEPKKKQ